MRASEIFIENSPRRGPISVKTFGLVPTLDQSKRCRVYHSSRYEGTARAVGGVNDRSVRTPGLGSQGQ